MAATATAATAVPEIRSEEWINIVSPVFSLTSDG
jgi:hypothetical protein